MNVNTDTCALCRMHKFHHSGPKKDGHSFVPLERLRPRGCKCDDLSSWSSAIPPVCTAFKPNPDDSDFCDSCEHDRDCHSAEAISAANQLTLDI